MEWPCQLLAGGGGVTVAVVGVDVEAADEAAAVDVMLEHQSA